MEKKKFQICERSHKSAIPFDWTKLPEDIIDKVDPKLIYNVLSVEKTGDLKIKSVLYFRPVTRFQNNLVIFETDELEYGI